MLHTKSSLAGFRGSKKRGGEPGPIPYGSHREGWLPPKALVSTMKNGERVTSGVKIQASTKHFAYNYEFSCHNLLSLLC